MKTKKPLPVLTPGCWIRYRYRYQWDYGKFLAPPGKHELTADPPPGTKVIECVWKNGGEELQPRKEVTVK